jgi:DNA-binding NarL/FixJ family response regulator
MTVALPPPPKFSIIYADDHRLVREAISNYINVSLHFQVIHSVPNGKELIALIKQGIIPHIVILDIEMPVLNGYDTAKWLKIHYPAIKILILTAFDNETVKAIAMANGAHAFSSKDISPLEMEAVLNQLTAVPSVMHTTNLSLSITEAEQLFLNWICTDKTYDEIAGCMHISLRQVERIRENLFDKLKTSSRTSLAVFAVKNGVITS